MLFLFFFFFLESERQTSRLSFFFQSLFFGVFLQKVFLCIHCVSRVLIEYEKRLIFFYASLEETNN